jgi:hypothetical protein
MTGPIPLQPVYRAYVLDGEGRFLSAHDLHCGNDEDALEAAKTFASGNAVELWERSRKIALIPPLERSGSHQAGA